MGMDNVLKGVVPVNQARVQPTRKSKQAKIKQANTRTVKTETQDRHQSPVKSASDSTNRKQLAFGFKDISREVISQQFAKGWGAFAPSNTRQVPLEVLKAKAQKLSDGLSSKPGYPTAFSVMGDKDKLQTPRSFYKPLAGERCTPAELNEIRLAGKDASIAELGYEVWRNVVQSQNNQSQRAQAYADYFRHLADRFEGSIGDCTSYEKNKIKWDADKLEVSLAQDRAVDQQSYEAQLTDVDKRELVREKEITELREQMVVLVAENNKVIKEGDSVR